MTNCWIVGFGKKNTTRSSSSRILGICVNSDRYPANTIELIRPEVSILDDDSAR